jgi:Tim44-like domain
MPAPKSLNLLILSAMIVVAAALAFPEEALARAGGGRSTGGGLLGLILWPLLALYSAVVTHYAVRKYKLAKQLMGKLATSDKAWNIDSIKARIEQAYFAIQYAWRDRNTESAKGFMSERLYLKHKTQLLDMRTRGLRDVMEDISLDSVKIVQVLDYSDDAKDSFVALVEGSMIDYMVNADDAIIDGDKKKRSFRELWKFKRETQGWVVDEIDSSVSLSDVKEMQVWSESVQ